MANGRYHEASANLLPVLAGSSPGRQHQASWTAAVLGRERDAAALFHGWSAAEWENRAEALTVPFNYHISTSSAAVSMILAEAETASIVFINESHHSSRHRVFVQRLLPELAALGYTYFAIEALSQKDVDQLSSADGRQYLSNLYLADPAFLAVIEAAKDLDLVLMSYDAGGLPGEACPNPCAPADQREMRERAQAHNIFQQTLAQDPAAKVIVYGGGGHPSQCRVPMGDRMVGRAGHYLQKMMGERRLLSIDQWNYHAEAQVPGPIAVPGDDCYDLQVYHRLDEHRGAWLQRAGRQHAVPISHQGGQPFQVFELFRPGQALQTPAIDRMMMLSGESATLWSDVPDPVLVVVEPKGIRRIVAR